MFFVLLIVTVFTFDCDVIWLIVTLFVLLIVTFVCKIDCDVVCKVDCVVVCKG